MMTSFSIRKLEDETLQSLINRVDEAVKLIQDLCPTLFSLEQLGKELAAMVLIRALPKEYNTFVSLLLLLDKLDKKTVQDAFITKEIQRRRRAADISSSAAAMAPSRRRKKTQQHAKQAQDASTTPATAPSAPSGEKEFAGNAKGYRYWVTFIDDHTRFRVVMLLNRKSGVFSAFQSFKALAENQLGRSIKALHNDKGGEYMSNEFNTFCDSHGILRRHTTRNRPQQNGDAERANRTMNNDVTAMLDKSKLPMHFWGRCLAAQRNLRESQPMT
ncbi:hypothetical protein MD484_g8596, partial [Candolleomyces efflorescens]